MIEKKIRSDIPLPMPRSVICSPRYITKTAPTVRLTVVVNVNSKPGVRTAPWMDVRKAEYPYPWMAARMTVT